MSERIAIIGMAGRFPGATTIDDFWRIVREGGDAISDFSEAELLAAGVSRAELADPHYVRSAPVLDDIAGFDAPFFGLSPEQAELLDPQHRLFFECAWEALEMAGHPPERFQGAIGVFAGCSISSYLLFNLLPNLRAGAAPATLLAMIGNEKDYLASHLAYLLGLTGPSIGVQTACSTSLVAVHLACQSLLAGECDLALAGGANVRVPHRVGYRYEEGSILSVTGRCRSFDAAADGTVFGSGAGIVVLRRLTNAVADGDPIQAVILGSAVNNDGGRKAGYTAPSVDGQAAVIAEALAVADVDAASIGYLEAHGTGTPIGDPIEIRALAEAFRGLPQGSIALGSVKAAFGHLEAAAGVVGLIAAALAVKHGLLPPVAHFRQANPLLGLEKTPFLPASAARPWRSDGPRRAGISSFGIGGTNAHVVIEAPPLILDSTPSNHPGATRYPSLSKEGNGSMLCLSARDQAALMELRQRYRAILTDETDFPALCRTAALGRRHFAERVAVVADSAVEARMLLAQATPVRIAAQPRLALLFSGQGSWVAGAGRGLATLPVVGAIFDRAEALVPGLQAALFDPTGDGTDTGIAQPALFALQWAVVAQLQAWGVEPVAVTGHSLGELAAAATAGVLGWEDGLRLAAARGRLMQALPAGGAMAAVFAPADIAQTALGSEAATVNLAAFNAPQTVVLSGDGAALQRVLDRLTTQGIAHQWLKVAHAFHSQRMEPILTELDLFAIGLPQQAPHLHWVSTLTGAVVTQLAQNHWSRHARQPVRFTEALQTLAILGCTAFLEIGPGATLTALTRLQQDSACIVPTLANADEPQALLKAVAALYAHGLVVDWAALLGPGPRAPAPTYPFQRRRYWRDPPLTPNPSPTRGEGGILPGQEFATPLARRLFVATVYPHTPDWLDGHRVDDRVILPGAVHAALALAAGLDGLSALSIEALLTIGPDGVELQTIVHKNGRVQIHAREVGSTDWKRYASAEPATAPADLGMENLAALTARCATPIAPEAFYQRLAAGGIVLGPRFQRLVEIRAGQNEALARLCAPDDLEPNGLLMHPLVLDALFQTLGAALINTNLPAHLPVALDRLQRMTGANPNAALWCHAALRPLTPGANGIIGDLSLLAADGVRLLQIEGLGCRPARSGGSIRQHLYTPVWRPCDPVHWPAPSTVAREVASTADLSDYLDYLPQVDALSTAYVAQAFIKLGARFVPGEPVRLATPIAPRFVPVLPRLWRMLEEDGLIDAEYRTLRIPDADPERRLTEIRARYPAQAPETGMLARCGAALAEVLTGTAEPLALLFAPSDRDDAGAVYAESRYAGTLNQLAVKALTRAIPANLPLRALEIGGGTGGTTRHLLPILPATTAEYRFTDVSPAFLQPAEQNFADYPFLHTALLDIERDPVEQGIDAGRYHLVVAANVLHATRDLAEAVAHAAQALTPGGWLLLVEGLRPSRWLDLTFGLTEGWQRGTDRALRPDDPLIDAEQWRRLLTEQGFDEVAVLTPGAGRLADQGVILARKRVVQPETVICRAALGAADPAAAVLPMLQTELGRMPRLLVATGGGQHLRPWETPDPAQAAVLGLVKAAALERPETQVRLVDLDPLDENAEATLAAESAIADGEREVAWRDGRRYALRLIQAEADPALPERFHLAPTAPGLLDSLSPQPLPERMPGPGEVAITVAAAGLNFKDVLMALGTVELGAGSGERLGGECAGTITAIGTGVTGFQIGDRVVALAGGSLASHINTPAGRVAQVPVGLTLEQAAALPVAAGTALHALRELGCLHAGQRILIHAATGGVGLFAIKLARAVGAEILATAGSPWKRAWLRRLGIQQVFDSRDPDFAAAVLTATDNVGVDLVLNSLTGAMIPAGLSVLKPGGRFIEIGRAGIWSAEQVAARFPNVDYRIVALDTAGEAEGGRLLHAVLEAVAAGELSPPPLTVLPMSRATEAFRLMQQTRHLGKIVLTHRPPFQFRPDRGYLITGGLGGLGLAVATWAVDQGAKHLALVSRHAPDTETAERLETLRKRGATLLFIAADLADATRIQRLSAELRAGLPPLAGIFHAAGCLDDAPLAEQSPERFAKVAGPKLAAIPHLANISPDLDAFVLFSSAAGLLGSPGQANHAAAATRLDALALHYQAQGLPMITIDWGAWRDIGAAARRQVGERLAETGMGALTPDEGLATLAWALKHRPVQVAALPIDWPQLRDHFGINWPPLFREFARAPNPVLAKAKQANPAPATLRDDLAALSPARRIERLAGLVETQARGLLTIGDAPLRHDRPLNELGLDSLLAVELRNRLGALAGTSLPATLLFNYPTIAALAEHLAALMIPASSPEPAAAVQPEAAGITETEEEILSLDEDDLDAILRDLERRHLP